MITRRSDSPPENPGPTDATEAWDAGAPRSQAARHAEALFAAHDMSPARD